MDKVSKLFREASVRRDALLFFLVGGWEGEGRRKAWEAVDLTENRLEQSLSAFRVELRAVARRKRLVMAEPTEAFDRREGERGVVT
jgi:hypothetical protein